MAVDSKYPLSVKAGKPILSECPNGWKKESLHNYLELVPRKVQLENDKEYDLLTVKRSRRGVVRREHLLGSQILVKSQFEVKTGDFVISKRQIVHGACGLVPEELDGSIVSNEYSVFQARPNFNLTYFKYLSETLYFQQTCFHSSIGVHIEKMIFKLDDWFKWNFNTPPLPEQQKISQILNTWDKAISTTESLIANSQQQKKSLMQQLLTCKKRFAGFEKKWAEVKMKDVSDVRDGTHDSPQFIEKGYPLITSKNLLKSGELDLENVKFISHDDYIQINKRSNVKVGDILFGMIGTIGTPVRVKLEDYAIKNVALIKEKKGMLNSFLIYYIASGFVDRQFHRLNAGGTQKFIALGVLRNLRVQVPDIEEQQKIVSVLSAADQEIDTLQQKLTHLKQEKKALMQQLLTGKRRVKVDNETEAA